MTSVTEGERIVIEQMLADQPGGSECFGDCCINKVEKRALIAALKYAMEVPVSGNQTGEEK